MNLNTQTPEKQSLGSGKVLLVNSLFPTIQGEGPFVGTPAVFVRLAGCNLQCPLCDTEYTARGEFALDRLLHDADSCLSKPRVGRRLLVLTGGEPFRQNIIPFLKAATSNEHMWHVQIETNGTLFVPLMQLNAALHCITIVCSPKAGRVNVQLEPYITAYKYVATAASLDADDGLPLTALDHPLHGRLARPPKTFRGEVFLQPVDEQDAARNAANLQASVLSCLRHGYRLCLQTHKIIGMP